MPVWHEVRKQRNLDNLLKKIVTTVIALTFLAIKYFLIKVCTYYTLNKLQYNVNINFI